jgi:hypothetical protein
MVMIGNSYDMTTQLYTTPSAFGILHLITGKLLLVMQL